MQKCCLCESRKCLVHTHDHRIRTELCGIFRERGMQAKMCAVGLIHNQRDSMPVNDFRNGSDI